MQGTELGALKGVGKARLQALQSAGIADLQGLLLRFPREYLYFEEPRPLRSVALGEKNLVRAKLLRLRTGYAKGRAITTAQLRDESGELEAVWFNQPYLQKQLEPGEEGFFYGYALKDAAGKVRLSNPLRFAPTESGILPLYAPLEGLPQKTYRSLVRQALELCRVEEILPDFVLQQFRLPTAAESLANVHFPADRAALAAALSRAGLEELLLFQLAALSSQEKETGGQAMAAGKALVQPFLDALGFPLTGAQSRVLGEILADMESDRPMARLVEGDVGCGKTALALAALYVAAQNGFQGALMAPTEVLAAQHYQGAKALLEPLGVRVGLLTGSTKARERRMLLESLENGWVDVLVGTHALISEGVRYHRLGLVVTDEQHRFGVRQRTRLAQKGLSPHVLVMSATPIPRTLALVLYADLSLSVVDELPPGRKPVTTRLVPESKREGLYGFLDAEMGRGRQVYVICPLVEETDELDAANAEQTFRDLQRRLPDRRVALLHGRMAGPQKEAVLQAFAAGQIDALVSTTVIEVGVNVPNATIMVIQNAERFGLAQLHQLRGRVGRGQEQSWCFLLGESSERLRFLCSTTDGFAVAQKDLELRGPGDFLGVRQHGLLDKNLLALAGDVGLLRTARDLATRVLKDPEDPQNARLLDYAKGYMQDKGFVFQPN